MMNVGSIYTQPREACVSQSLKALRNNEIVFVHPASSYIHKNKKYNKINIIKK